jgi:hypothetical protein
VGDYSNDLGATACEGPCGAGSYVSDVANDTDGVGVAAGGQFCILCPAGKFGEEEGSSSCQECPSGKSSEQGSTECSDCPGEYGY